MPLLNIFTGKELGPDDWSGKRTVKTGQLARSTTTASSIGTENALPSSAPGYLNPVLPSGKVSVSSVDSAEASSDDNSTTVVNDGIFIEQVVVSDSEEEGDTEGMDDYSLDGYGGGCLDCHDMAVDDSIEYIDSVDSEAIDYWKRVKANRKRSLARKPSTHSISNIEHVTEESDNTQIEVVNDEKSKPPQTVPDDGEEMETKKSSKSSQIFRMVQSLSKSQMVKVLSKSQRQSRNEIAAVDATIRTTEADGSSCEEVTNITAENHDCVEVEAQPPQKKMLSSLKRMLSNPKLLLRDDQELALVEHSCASSTEDQWVGDKYKIPDESVTSEQEDALEVNTEEEPTKDPEAEGSQEIVDVLPGSSENRAMARSYSEKLRSRQSAWHASVKSGVATARSMRTTASLRQVAKKMSSARIMTDARIVRKSVLKRASQSASLRHVGKGLKHGVSRLRKMGKRSSISEPNLVVCIDGKGDRLGPKSSAKSTPENSVTGSDSDPSYDQDSQSGASMESSVDPRKNRGDVVVEVDGGRPVVFEMCLMSANVSLESDPALQAFVFEGDANSVCSSAPSEVEAMGLLAATQDACSVGSGTESADSDSDSESSHGDLNTLSSDSGDDDSIVYELFPSVSFSSLTGIQCRDGCTKVTIRDFDSESDLRVSEALIRGRSRVRSRGRRGQGRAGAGAMRTRGVSSRSSNFGFNSDKGVQDVGEEDSIISCKAEEPERKLSSKIREALFQ